MNTIKSFFDLKNDKTESRPLINSNACVITYKIEPKINICIVLFFSNIEELYNK